MSEFEKILRSRSKNRPTASDYISGIFTAFTEFHGDRRFGDDKAIVSGIALLDGKPVTVIGIEKGRETSDKIYRNFGSAHPEGYRKALRLMKQAEKFHRPIVCLVDTAGAACDVEAEARGEGQAIAENLYEMMTLRTPIVSIVIGEGGSGGALALAVADRVWMMENAYYSVVSPEGCASILWKDASKADRAAEALHLGAENLLSLEIIESVISEGPSFESEEGRTEVFRLLQRNLTGLLEELSEKDVDSLLEERYNKFRKIGRKE
jgi:acetyl-CoA carboxylase carboxyl transferase subunit alpha